MLLLAFLAGVMASGNVTATIIKYDSILHTVMIDQKWHPKFMHVPPKPIFGYTTR